MPKPPPGTPLNTANSLSTGLVGIWPFNEGSGVPINAVTGTAAASNTLAWATDGTRGTVLSGDGVGEYATLPVSDGSPLDVTGATGITISAWVKPTITGNFQLLIGKMGAAGRQYGVYLSATGTSNLYCVFSNALNQDVDITSPWVVGAWNFVAVTYDGSSALTYINGAFTGGLAGGSSSLFANVSGTPIVMGYEVAAPNYPLDGLLDLPAIWARVLSADDIAAYYANPWQVFLDGPPTPPTGEAVQPGIEFRFDAPIVATGLTMTVQNLTTLGYVSGTTSYNATTRIVSWVASPATPLRRGTKYLITITGVTAADGTPQTAPITFSFTPSGRASLRYMPGGGRRVGKLMA